MTLKAESISLHGVHLKCPPHPSSAPLLQSAGWEEGTDSPALKCAKPTQRLFCRHSNTSHPLLPTPCSTPCSSLPGGHRLPSPLPLHCSQQGILCEVRLIRDVEYSLGEMQTFCCLTDLWMEADPRNHLPHIAQATNRNKTASSKQWGTCIFRDSKFTATTFPP